ncbi:MAG: hypothetical protein ACI4HO_05055 [Ruminococcus sp.]
MSISEIADIIASVVAVLAFAFTILVQYINSQRTRKAETIKAFNLLQNESLDKLAELNKTNAKNIVSGKSESEAFRTAYYDYKVLIARVEHFAIGVNNKVYDFNIVDELAGEHLVYLYNRVKPIIDEANKRNLDNSYYGAYSNLVEKLKKKHHI